jgi:hypothetical protein
LPATRLTPRAHLAGVAPVRGPMCSVAPLPVRSVFNGSRWFSTRVGKERTYLHCVESFTVDLGHWGLINEAPFFPPPSVATYLTSGEHLHSTRPRREAGRTSRHARLERDALRVTGGLAAARIASRCPGCTSGTDAAQTAHGCPGAATAARDMGGKWRGVTYPFVPLPGS